jgi:hypothetical protein
MAWSKTLPHRVRSEDAVVQLKARMREPIRAELEASAKRRGVSLNAELVDRVEKSFAEEDAFGGPEIANMARLMAAAFLRGGQAGAHASRHPKWSVARWINDPNCYQAAVAAVVNALHAMQPGQSGAKHPSPADRSGTLTVRYHDGEGEKEVVFSHEAEKETSSEG